MYPGPLHFIICYIELKGELLTDLRMHFDSKVEKGRFTLFHSLLFWLVIEGPKKR
jgi:hypothetical protein